MIKSSYNLPGKQVPSTVFRIISQAKAAGELYRIVIRDNQTGQVRASLSPTLAAAGYLAYPYLGPVIKIGALATDHSIRLEKISQPNRPKKS